MRAALLLTAGLLAASTGFARAQDEEPQPVGSARYIDAATDSVLPKGGLGVRTEARLFGGYEDKTYLGIGARFGLGNGLEGALRGVFANKRNTTAGNGAVIRHGGNDFEALLKYRPAGSSQIAGMIGVSSADTPAQSDTFLTLGAAISRSLSDTVEVTLNPRAVLIEDNTIVGIGLGASARLGEGLYLSAEYTPILTGDNTRSTTDGSLKRRDLYGISIHYAPPNGKLDFSVGYTNATGATTGFSLTPALGGTGAVYFGVALRR